MEYNEELGHEKSDGAEEENPLNSRKSKRTGKLHRYQQEGRQQPKRSVKKNLWIENDKADDLSKIM